MQVVISKGIHFEEKQNNDIGDWREKYRYILQKNSFHELIEEKSIYQWNTNFNQVLAKLKVSQTNHRQINRNRVNFLSFLQFTFRYSKSVSKKNNCKNENVSLIVFPTLFVKYLLPTKWIIPWYCHKFSISYSGNKIYCKSKKLIFLECLSDLSRNMAHMSAYFSPRSSKHYHGISFYFFQNVQFNVCR